MNKHHGLCAMIHQFGTKFENFIEAQSAEHMKSEHQAARTAP